MFILPDSICCKSQNHKNYEWRLLCLMFDVLFIFMFNPPLSLSSHHSCRPAQLHLHQIPGPASSAGSLSRPGRDSTAGHHQPLFFSHPTRPVAPPDAGPYAHSVSHLAAGENARRNRPAATAADTPAHQHVWTAAAGTGMIRKETQWSVLES